MTPNRCRAAMLLAGAFLPALPAPADVTLQRDVRREVTTFAERTLRFAVAEQIRIQGDKVRIGDLTLGQTLVVRLDRKVILHLDHLRKTAAVLTFDQVAARRAAALDGVRGARDLVRDTPDAARLDAVLRGFGVFAGGPPKVERRAGGEKAAVAGREASRVQVEVDGEARLDLWLTDGPAEARAYIDALAALQAVPPEVAEALRRAPGLPLREDSRYAWFLDRVRVQAETKAVDAEPIPADAFEAPAGYKTAPFALLPEEEAKDVVMPIPDGKK